MDSNLNRGAWKSMENTWSDALKEGKTVEVKIKTKYIGESKRPDSFIVRYRIEGENWIRETFINKLGGK